MSQPFIFCALFAETRTSPFLSSIFSKRTGIVSPSLILSLKIHGLIMPIIILPLFLPILVFGVGALDVLIFNGFEELFFRQLALLAGVSGLSMAFCPIASAFIIKTNYD